MENHRIEADPLPDAERALAGVAWTAATLVRELVNQGFTREEALRFTTEWMLECCGGT